MQRVSASDRIVLNHQRTQVLLLCACCVFCSKCPYWSLRSRGLYHRGGASTARAGRSCVGPVCSRGSPVSDHDSEQTDEALQCPLPHLYQQVGPHGRQPQASPAANEVWLCSQFTSMCQITSDDLHKELGLLDCYLMLQYQ